MSYYPGPDRFRQGNEYICIAGDLGSGRVFKQLLQTTKANDDTVVAEAMANFDGELAELLDGALVAV